MVKNSVKTTILVVVTIAALGAVGITTSIMSAVPVHATTEINGHVLVSGLGSGGGHVILNNAGKMVKCVGSQGFRNAVGCPLP